MLVLYRNSDLQFSTRLVNTFTMIPFMIMLIFFNPADLIENPIDINHASYYEISEIPFLRDDQIDLILRTRPFRNFADFVKKTRLDPITSSLVRDYVYFSPSILKRAKISFAYTTKTYFDLYLRTDRSNFSFSLRDTLAKYRFYYRLKDFYIITGTVRPSVPTFSERPHLSFTGVPGLFVDYRGFSIFYSKDRYLFVSPQFLGFSAFFLKTTSSRLGIIWRKRFLRSKIMVRASIIRRPIFDLATYWKLKGAYFSARLTYSEDTIRSSVHFSTLITISDYLTLKLYSRTIFEELPSTISYFEIYLPTENSLRYRFYESRTSVLEIENPLGQSDTLQSYLKIIDRSRFGVNVEFIHGNMTCGFSLITTDKSFGVRERDVRYQEWVYCGDPCSDIYLTGKRSVKGFDLRVKLGYSRSTGLKFHFGGSYTWRL